MRLNGLTIINWKIFDWLYQKDAAILTHW
jgi:hypothetical protein